MGNSKDRVQSEESIELRHHAEARLRSVEPETVSSMSDFAVRRLLHELQVHQIELELQNLELCQSRDQGEALLENYTELYDFAPVGYCTLDPNGTIRRVNLTGAGLLGEERSRLMNRRLGMFVSAENKRLFNDMLARVFSDHQQKAHCEVVIHPNGLRPSTPVKIVAMASATGDECLAVIIDITERKRLEAQILIAKDDLELRRVQERSTELLTLNRMLREEIANRNLLEDTLRDSQRKLRNLSASLQSIREEERKAIAREIHDELGQLLARIQIGVSLLATECPDNQKLVLKIRGMEIMLGEGIKTVQRISAALRPAMLEVLGLPDALEWQCKEFIKGSGVNCKITVLLMDKAVPPDVAIVIFRIFQESLTNVQRHSQATNVEAYLVERRQSYVLTIRDDGRGVTQEEIASSSSIGLIGIRERVLILGGRMKIYGYPEKGTTIFVRVPVKAKEN